MSWVTWLLVSLLGYEAVSLIVARVLYRNMTFDNYVPAAQRSRYSSYTVNGRHAGKAWGIAQTWGLWVLLVPPFAVLWGTGWLAWSALCLAADSIEWFIKSDELSVKNLVPHKPDLAALTEAAEADYEKAGQELDKIQGKFEYVEINPEEYH